MIGSWTKLKMNNVFLYYPSWRIRLTNHLDLIVCMFVQKFFTLEIFPYQEAILVWKKEKKWYAYNTWVIIEVQWCCVNCNDFFCKLPLSFDGYMFQVVCDCKWQVASVIYINFYVNKLVATVLQGYKLIVTCWILFHKACHNAFVIRNLDNGHYKSNGHERSKLHYCRLDLGWRVVIGCNFYGIMQFNNGCVFPWDNAFNMVLFFH